MTRHTPIALAALTVAAAFLGGCSRDSLPGAQAARPKIVVQLDWFAEPEHGAFYEAQALGYFREEGLDVELDQGGPNAYVLAKVAAGRAQIGQSDSTNVLLAIASGAPIVNVASLFQHDPTVLMMHASNPVRGWKDLDGRSIMARPEWAFLPYLRAKYRIGFNVIPQNFDLGRLASDPSFIQMGYGIAEPYQLRKKGVDVRLMWVTSTGYDDCATIVTSRAFAAEHPEELRAFLRALRRGYQAYVEGDPAPAHALMLAINPKATADYLDWSRRQIIDAGLARDARGDYLALSPERYQRQISQMEELGILPKGKVTPGLAMDGSFLRRSPDPANP